MDGGAFARMTSDTFTALFCRKNKVNFVPDPLMNRLRPGQEPAASAKDQDL
jgi:hypothetical protein